MINHLWNVVVAVCAITGGMGWQMGMSGDKLGGAVVMVLAILALPLFSQLLKMLDKNLQ